MWQWDFNYYSLQVILAKSWKIVHQWEGSILPTHLESVYSQLLRWNLNSEIWDFLKMVPKVFQPDSFILFANLTALFCTRFKVLTRPSLYGPNTPLHTQVSVSLVPYKLNVLYYYFPFWVYILWNEVPSMPFVMYVSPFQLHHTHS